MNLLSYGSYGAERVNIEILKIVTLLAGSQSEMRRDLKFGRNMNSGTKIDKFCGEMKQVFYK